MAKKEKKTIHMHIQNYLEKNREVVKNKADLSRTIGITWSALNIFDTGNGFLSDHTLEKIAKFFQEDVEDVKKEFTNNIKHYMSKRGLQ